MTESQRLSEIKDIVQHISLNGLDDVLASDIKKIQTLARGLAPCKRCGMEREKGRPCPRCKGDTMFFTRNPTPAGRWR